MPPPLHDHCFPSQWPVEGSLDEYVKRQRNDRSLLQFKTFYSKPGSISPNRRILTSPSLDLTVERRKNLI